MQPNLSVIGENQDLNCITGYHSRPVPKRRQSTQTALSRRGLHNGVDRLIRSQDDGVSMHRLQQQIDVSSEECERFVLPTALRNACLCVCACVRMRVCVIGVAAYLNLFGSWSFSRRMFGVVNARAVIRLRLNRVNFIFTANLDNKGIQKRNILVLNLLQLIVPMYLVSMSPTTVTRTEKPAEEHPENHPTGH